MKKRYVGADRSSPQLPVLSTVLVWLTLDRLKPSDLILGMVWTIWGIIVLFMTFSFFYRIATESKGTPLFKEDTQ